MPRGCLTSASNLLLRLVNNSTVSVTLYGLSLPRRSHTTLYNKNIFRHLLQQGHIYHNGDNASKTGLTCTQYCSDCYSLSLVIKSPQYFYCSFHIVCYQLLYLEMIHSSPYRGICRFLWLMSELFHCVTSNFEPQQFV